MSQPCHGQDDLLTLTKNGHVLTLTRLKKIISEIQAQFDDRKDIIRIALYSLKQKCENAEYQIYNGYDEPLIRRGLLDEQDQPLPDVCEMVDAMIGMENDMVVLVLPIEVEFADP